MTWRDGKPEALPLGTCKQVEIRAACGDVAVGKSIKGARCAAVRWTSRADGVALEELRSDGHVDTYATACGGGAVVGSGATKGKNRIDVALVWRGDSPAVVVKAEGEVSLHATDGTAHAGNLDLRAALWRDDHVTLLGPTNRSTTAVAICDGEQVGEIWTSIGPHAVMWRGSEASMLDLNPPGYETSRATACAGGIQVGFCKQRERLESGIDDPRRRACAWRGSVASWIDLHAHVPAPWTASVASAVASEGGVVTIVGHVEAFEDDRAITARNACTWTLR